MSGFWASVRGGRRGSSNANLTSNDLRPPSGRSSVSRDSRKDRFADAGNDGSDGEGNDSRDRGFMNSLKTRLPSSLRKRFRTTSVPKHSARKEMDPVTSEHPIKPPTPTSTKIGRRIFGKRAASVSPSRMAENGQEKRKLSRKLSKDRFVAQMPDQLKNLLKRKSSKEYPEKEGIPPKPGRRPGPVGRTWVKVFDDITYMDDSRNEDEPILGYTGMPTKVPDACPLPVAPTPPPQKRPPSIESEYDNVLPKEIRIQQEIEEIKDAEKENEVIQTAVVLDQDAKPRNEIRKSRSRENTRFKGKKQKRVGTPVRAEGLEMTQNEKFSDDSESETGEDGYIIPKPVIPSKPPRGHKIYETIKTPSEKKDEIETKTMEIKVTSSELASSDGAVDPPRPKRGIKIYETIEIKREPMPIDDKSPGSVVQNEMKKEPEGCEESSVVKKVLPSVPKRGVRVYETLSIATTVKEGKDKIPKDETNLKMKEIVAEQEPSQNSSMEKTEKEIPLKPARGSKIYAKVVIEKVPISEDKDEFEDVPLDDQKIQTESITETCTSTQISDQLTTLKKEICVEDLHYMDSSSVEDVRPSQSETPVPAYTSVLKDNKTNELKQVLIDAFDSIPPPIPPKKKDIRVITPDPESQDTLYDILPPRPPRHLKPSRTRSLDPSPCRPKRQKIISTTAHGDEVKKTGVTKVYAGIAFKTDPPMTDLQAKKSATLPRTKDGTDSAFRPVPMRRSHGRLPAPPRKKRHDPLTARLTLDPDKGPTVTLANDQECYENLEVNESRLSPITNDITLSTITPAPEKQDRIPCANAQVIENGVPMSPRIAANESDATITSISTEQTSRVNGALRLGLESDIDENLKNIEQSFEKLDTVLKTLKNYSRKSPSRIILRENLRMSCDVICDIVSTEIGDSSLSKQTDICVSKSPSDGCESNDDIKCFDVNNRTDDSDCKCDVIDLNAKSISESDIINKKSSDETSISLGQDSQSCAINDVVQTTSSTITPENVFQSIVVNSNNNTSILSSNSIDIDSMVDSSISISTATDEDISDDPDTVIENLPENINCVNKDLVKIVLISNSSKIETDLANFETETKIASSETDIKKSKDESLLVKIEQDESTDIISTEAESEIADNNSSITMEVLEVKEEILSNENNPVDLIIEQEDSKSIDEVNATPLIGKTVFKETFFKNVVSELVIEIPEESKDTCVDEKGSEDISTESVPEKHVPVLDAIKEENSTKMLTETECMETVDSGDSKRNAIDAEVSAIIAETNVAVEQTSPVQEISSQNEDSVLAEVSTKEEISVSYEAPKISTIPESVVKSEIFPSIEIAEEPEVSTASEVDALPDKSSVLEAAKLEKVSADTKDSIKTECDSTSDATATACEQTEESKSKPIIPTTILASSSKEPSFKTLADELEDDEDALLLQSGVSELATRLEGIRSQLEAVITNYPVADSTNQNDSPPSSSIKSGSYRSAESAFSIPFFYSGPFQDDLANRDSLCSTPQTYHSAVSPSASYKSDLNISTPSPPQSSPSPPSSPSSSTKQPGMSGQDSSSAEENLESQ